jgi:glutamate-1-semialdehyde 2,1-aminomutase
LTIGTVIQARLSSSRLPGKVLADVLGRPMLARQLERVARARRPHKVIVATTVDPSDQPIADFCAREDVTCTRGSLNDVLDRYYQTAKAHALDVVVRVTADCPVLDPAVIDDVIDHFLDHHLDYGANTAPPEGSTYPDGMDVEVFSFAALERAWKEAAKPSEREHVTFHFWKNADRFRIGRRDLPRDLSALRLTVDYPADLEVVRALYTALYPVKPDFSLEDIAAYLEAHPELKAHNAEIERNAGWQPSLAADAAARPMAKCLDYQARARRRIPGAVQLLSKRPEQFAPGQWPGYYTRAEGVLTWDLDGNRYVDMSISGIGANVLGFADPDVNAAVQRVVADGNMSSLNAPEEVELAELLCELHPWASMVRYARGGGEAMAMAVRIARAHTGRDKIVFSGYHGWQDWYLAANLGDGEPLTEHLLPGLEPAGVPRGLRGTALPFRYGRLDELEAHLAHNPGEVAAVVMEPLRDRYPEPDFLPAVRRLATAHGAVLVFDEITAAFRLNTGGAHLLFDVAPDIAVFAKAISNGYPMAAILGRGDVMQAAQRTFISSTYWTDRIGPTAALATIRKHRQHDVARHLIDIGERVQGAWREAAAAAGLNVHVSGIPPLSHFHFEHPPHAQEMITLYTQMMLERGFLASGRFYASFAHQPAHVEAYARHTREVFAEIARLLEGKALTSALKGPPAHTGFTRLT